MSTVYYGSVINPQSVTDYLALPRCLICVSPQGDIEWIVEDVENTKLNDVLAQHNCAHSDITLVCLNDGEFLMPGLVDTHTVRPVHCQGIHILIIFCILSMLVKSLTSACKLHDTSIYDLTLYASFSGGEMELLQWLDNYTFPTEVRFKDVKYAERAYPDVVRRIVNSGVSN